MKLNQISLRPFSFIKCGNRNHARPVFVQMGIVYLTVSHIEWETKKICPVAAALPYCKMFRIEAYEIENVQHIK